MQKNSNNHDLLISKVGFLFGIRPQRNTHKILDTYFKGRK